MYQELNDLLDPARRNLKVREDRTKGVHVDGLTDVVLESVDQALCLINKGIKNRQVSVFNACLVPSVFMLFGVCSG